MAKASIRLLRLAPIAVLCIGLLLVYFTNVADYFDFRMLVQKRHEISVAVSAHPYLACFGYMILYVAIVTLSLPFATVLTIFGGFLFGWLPASVMVVISATTGAILVFLAARTAFGDILHDRAQPFMRKFGSGFEDGAFGYLLALRLAPVFPFFATNILPAFFHIRLSTFALSTFIGIIPGVLAFAWLGNGLDMTLENAAKSGRDLVLSDLVSWPMTLSLAALSALALGAAILRRHLRSRTRKAKERLA
jgi:uncharacterized membrane protein YdjX (TVP38/TMEM64 family)